MRAIIKGQIIVDHPKVLEYLLQESNSNNHLVEITWDAQTPSLKKIYKAFAGRLQNHENLYLHRPRPTHLEEILLHHLHGKGWLPNMPQSDHWVLERRDEILKTIKHDHLPVVVKTYVSTIFDFRNQCWGILNRPTNTGFEFRIKEPIPQKLRDTCERLVSDIEHAVVKFPIPLTHSANGSDNTSALSEAQFFVDILPLIEVLEPGSEHQAFIGEVYTKSRWRLALEEKNTEVKVGLFASIVALILLVVTTPFVVNFLTLNLDPDWLAWVKGTLDRLATSAIFTATVSFISVYLHWRQLRKSSTSIRWVTSRQ
jgi:hypothetical protein